MWQGIRGRNGVYFLVFLKISSIGIIICHLVHIKMLEITLGSRSTFRVIIIVIRTRSYRYTYELIFNRRKLIFTFPIFLPWWRFKVDSGKVDRRDNTSKNSFPLELFLTSSTAFNEVTCSNFHPSLKISPYFLVIYDLKLTWVMLVLM